VRFEPRHRGRRCVIRRGRGRCDEGRRRLPAQFEQLAHQTGGFIAVVADRETAFLQIAALEKAGILEHQLGVSDDGHQAVVERVRDAACQHPQALPGVGGRRRKRQIVPERRRQAHGREPQRRALVGNRLSGHELEEQGTTAPSPQHDRRPGQRTVGLRLAGFHDLRRERVGRRDVDSPVRRRLRRRRDRGAAGSRCLREHHAPLGAEAALDDVHGRSQRRGWRRAVRDEPAERFQAIKAAL
jgi:hypothetical protein